MVAVVIPEEGHEFEAHNESILHASFVDFERRGPDRSIEQGKRIVLAPGERRKVKLAAGTVYITPGRGVVFHGL